ncbi:MAG: glycosyltransferase [Lachnospiraceae bacterium]|nr:glycosyltransferase [Lachnospiraceae bacterium]
MKIDILIAVAEKGGVENVVNMVIPYFRNQRNWEVRVVQLVWEGFTWTDEETPFYPLLRGRAGHTQVEFVESYAGFLKDHGVPDMVLATAWPYMCYVAKYALDMLDAPDKKVISWLHAPVERYKAAGFGDYEQLALADAHLAISQYIYDELKCNLADSLVVAIKNPVDFSKIVPKEDKSTPADADGKKLFYVGRISVEKRLDVIIRALGKADAAWELWVIGDGEKKIKDELKQLAKQCHVQNRIHWMGWKSNPWEHASEADALVVASEYEGFGLVAVEALACGIPVISTPVGKIPELISQGVNGYTFPKGDWKSLADILNAMAGEENPAISSEDCMSTAAPYEKDIAIMDFVCKLEELACYQNEMILSGAGQRYTYYGDKISIIVPCYNASKYIKECIDSMLASSLPLNMLEFIFVDDASEDNTCEIIQEYEEQHPENILLIKCSENRKQGAARNIGMSYATGNYICFVDSDDIIHPEMLQKLYEKAALFGCDMTGCGYILFKENGNEQKFVSEEKLYFLTEPAERQRFILLHGCKNAVWHRIYRKQFLEENEIYFPENIIMEDLFFSELCMMMAKTCFEIPDTLYYYRTNPNGTMLTVNQSNFLDTFLVQDSTYCTLFEKNIVNGYEQELALIYYVKAFVEPLSRMKNGTNGIVWDEEVYQLIKKTIFSRFPDILQNPYILSDKSEYNMKFLKLLSE